VKGFRNLLAESMDLAVRQVLGESASELIYSLMERQAALKQDEIGEKIEAFAAYLERLLGSERACILEVAGLNRLCLMLRREYEEVEKYLSLLDELYEVKFRLMVPSGKEEGSAWNRSF
jgi:hypothetical protein